MRIYNTHWRDVSVVCQETHAVLHCLNRQDELRRLIAWAGDKRLPGPRSAYLVKLDDAERKLLQYTISSPRLIALARFVHGFKTLLTPTPRYLPKGSASMYRQAKT